MASCLSLCQTVNARLSPRCPPTAPKSPPAVCLQRRPAPRVSGPASSILSNAPHASRSQIPLKPRFFHSWWAWIPLVWSDLPCWTLTQDFPEIDADPGDHGSPGGQGPRPRFHSALSTQHGARPWSPVIIRLLKTWRFHCYCTERQT